MRLIDLTGRRFGRLVVLARADTIPHGDIRWACKCDCGGQSISFGSNLRSGHTTSCGCAMREFTSTLNLKHGQARTGKKSATYQIWQGIRKRCNDAGNRAYQWYGARGIKICERWNDYPSFLEDMGPRPEGLSIERINNDGNYEPGNCRWATAIEQANNKRTTKLSADDRLSIKRLSADGMSSTAIAARFGISSAHARRTAKQ